MVGEQLKFGWFQAELDAEQANAERQYAQGRADALAEHAAHVALQEAEARRQQALARADARVAALVNQVAGSALSWGARAGSA